MINTPDNRTKYHEERSKMAINERIGLIVLAVIVLCWSAVILGGLVRLCSLAIVAVHHMVK